MYLDLTKDTMIIMVSLDVLKSFLACEINDELLAEYPVYQLAIDIDPASKSITDSATLWEGRAVCRRLSRYEEPFTQLPWPPLISRLSKVSSSAILTHLRNLHGPLRRNSKVGWKGFADFSLPVCLWLHPILQ
jgi:hypothetical protein